MEGRSIRRSRLCRIRGRRPYPLTRSFPMKLRRSLEVARINLFLWWTITEIPWWVTIRRNVGLWRMGRNGIYTMMIRAHPFRIPSSGVIRILCGLSGSKGWNMPLDRCSKDNVVYDFTLCVIHERSDLIQRRTHFCHLCWSRPTI